MTTIEFVVGDSSGDGHDKKNTYTVESNLSKQDIQSAYNKATAILGFDFVNYVCLDYEDNILKEEYVKILTDNGFDINNYDDDGCWGYNTRNAFLLSSKSYLKLYLDIIKFGNNEFEYKLIESVKINIGGYGLFY